MDNTSQKKVAYAFNKFYLNFLTDLKSYNEDFKKQVKANFKVFDKTSLDHVDAFKRQMKEQKPDDEVELLPGLTLRAAVDAVEGDKETVKILMSYVYIFKALAHIYEDNDEALDTILSIIHKIKAGEDVSMDIDVVVDDDLRGHLEHLADTLDAKVEDAMKMFENSMIGNLAKEISEEINVQDLNVENPADLLNFESLMSGSNNVLGNIVSKVSNKIQSKIADGQLNQADLVGEAMNLISMLNTTTGAGGMGGNPAFSDLMNNITKSMGDLRVDPSKVRQMDTRQRLRTKLEEKRAQQSQHE